MRTKDFTPGLSYKDFGMEFKDVTESGNFIGYGSVFNNVDFGKDIVLPGAFTETLERRAKSGRKLPVLYQHRSGEPLGVFDSHKEDDVGLLMTGSLLVKEVQRAKETHALMKIGALSGMSIGYREVEARYDSATKVNSLIKLDLHETSIVTFPMNDEARIQGVKGLITIECLKKGTLPSLSEFENFLCEAGFSRTQAKAVAGGGLRKLLDRCEADGNTTSAAVMKVLQDFKLP